jgi:hypothetical protein
MVAPPQLTPSPTPFQQDTCLAIDCRWLCVFSMVFWVQYILKNDPCRHLDTPVYAIAISMCDSIRNAAWICDNCECTETSVYSFYTMNAIELRELHLRPSEL